MCVQHYKGQRFGRPSHNAGFTMIELCAVMLIILVLFSFAVPGFVNMMHSYRLSAAVTDFASLLQVQRLRAVDDDRFYSSYVLNYHGAQVAYVDIYPQNSGGASGNGGTAYSCSSGNCDPDVTIHNEVNPQLQANAPSTSSLQGLFLPAHSPVTPTDAMASGTPITFGTSGLPCSPSGAIFGSAKVCDPTGGQTAYWIFFQDSVTQNWGAVTITPAGRVQRWLYTGGSSGTWANY